jgi:hypothetical protein
MGRVYRQRCKVQSLRMGLRKRCWALGLRSDTRQRAQGTVKRLYLRTLDPLFQHP